MSFSFQRLFAIVLKEFIQMRRDRLTFGMMIGVPMIQLILFGYAINSNPKHLPTAVYAADNSVFSRSFIWGLRNSSYFDLVREAHSPAEINNLLAENKVQFAVTIPVDFSRKLVCGEKPDLLLEADATDPSAVGFAQAAVSGLVTTILNRDLTGPLAKLQASAPPFNIVSHQHYNPESISQYNIVPSLMDRSFASHPRLWPHHSLYRVLFPCYPRVFLLLWPSLLNQWLSSSPGTSY